MIVFDSGPRRENEGLEKKRMKWSVRNLGSSEFNV